MEILAILAGVVVVFVVILVIGSMDNARPVSGWSDEKLQRMYMKLLHASTAQSNREKSNKYFQKSQEVKHEIEKRREKATAQFATEMADKLAPSIQAATQRTLEVVQKIMAEQKVDFEQAHKIVGKRLSETTTKYLAQGMTDDQAQAAAMKEIFNL
jgi:hypothetical protein